MCFLCRFNSSENVSFCYKIILIFDYFYFQIQKKKNIERDVFGTKTGRIHMQSQDLDKLQLRKSKALKRSADPQNAANKKPKRTK